MRLPDEFVSRMNDFFEKSGVTKDGFFESFDNEPLKGIRINRMKTSEEDYSKVLNALSIDEKKVTWCDGGFYSSIESSGKDPYYHCGVYYPTEPSAMLPAQTLAAKPGEIVLDLCAAPGGKACRLGEDMQGEGLLVANEINEDRAKALLRNIERTGITNAVILNETPEHLADRFDAFFDKILVDAPCSGEGMFRRDQFATKSWEKFGPEVCMEIQREILKCTDIMLKPGGELVYSTCTFCEGEDEDMILNFLNEHPNYEVIPHPEFKDVNHAGEGSKVPGSMRIWPHLSEGDGHFCVHLRKNPSENDEPQRYDYSFALKKRSDNYSFNQSKVAMLDFMKDILTKDGYDRFNEKTKKQFVFHNNKIHLVPLSEHLFDRLKVVKMGHFPGEIKETYKCRIFMPSHCLALSLKFDEIKEESKVCLSRDEDRLIRYLKGETINMYDEEKTNIKSKGYVVICCDSYPLGLGKLNGDGSIKNLYPKAWRLV